MHRISNRGLLDQWPQLQKLFLPLENLRLSFFQKRRKNARFEVSFFVLKSTTFIGSGPRDLATTLLTWAKQRAKKPLPESKCPLWRYLGPQKTMNWGSGNSRLLFGGEISTNIKSFNPFGNFNQRTREPPTQCPTDTDRFAIAIYSSSYQTDLENSFSRL